MKKKPKFILIKSTIFPYDVLFTTAPDVDIYRYIEQKMKYKLNDNERELLKAKSSQTAHTVRLRCGHIVVSVKPVKTTVGIDVCTLAHELVHAVFLIHDNTGAVNETELTAYHVEYLMREILKVLDP